MKKVVEVINFLHELDLLEAHLDEHQHFIDQIVVLESRITYSGMPKPLIFQDNKERFRRFNILYHEVPVDIFTPIPGSYGEDDRKKWFNTRRNNREAQQAYLFEKFKGLGDYICNADADEIWSRDCWNDGVMTCMNEDYLYIAPKVKLFFHYIDSMGSRTEHWRISKSTAPSHVRQKHVKRGASHGKIGWHFTGCYKDPVDIWYKGVGIAQSCGYLGWGNVPSPESCQDIIDSGQIPFANQAIDPVKIMDLEDLSWLPEFVRNNKDKYPWLLDKYRQGKELSDWKLPQW